MNLPKTILIGGVTTAVVVAGAGIYFALDNPQTLSAESLLVDYQELLEEMRDSKTKNSLLDNCENPQKFADQIQALEEKLDTLKKKKINLINTADKADNDEWIPPLPGSEPLEFDKPAPEETDEWIPPIPGSEVPDLDPQSSSDEPASTDQKEWIPPLPGSETPDLVPLSEADKPASADKDEWIPPLPESEPLDLTPTPGSDSDLAPVEEEFIPKLGAQPLEIDPTPGNTVIDKINYIEKEIIAELNSLKSLCDKEEKKEIISTSCVDACKKYSDCASYTEGVTKEDLQDAYDSCFEECQKWSDKTKICINKKPITAPIDCENLSFCALPEYGGGYSR